MSEFLKDNGTEILIGATFLLVVGTLVWLLAWDINSKRECRKAMAHLSGEKIELVCK